jgi:hypothetical protein
MKWRRSGRNEINFYPQHDEFWEYTMKNVMGSITFDLRFSRQWLWKVLFSRI